MIDPPPPPKKKNKKKKKINDSQWNPPSTTY